MAVNFGQLKTRIAGDVNRSATQFDTELGNAIVSAIVFLEQENLFFNQKTGTLTLASGDSSVSLPTDFKAMITLQALVGTNYIGEKENFKGTTFNTLWADNVLTSQSGSPNQWAIFAGGLYFDRPADQDYTLRIAYNYGDATYPSSPADTSVWFQDVCVDAVRYKAEALFWRDTLHDLAKANEYETMTAATVNRLYGRNTTQYYRRSLNVSPTTNYLLQKPTVGGDTDAWGTYLNQNPDYLETYLGLPRVTYADAGSKSGAVSINAATANYQRITLTGNLTSLAFTNWPTVPTSNGYAIRIDVVQGGTGNYTAVLGASFKTPGGDGLGTITLSSAVGARDVLCITSYDGTTFDVFVTNNMA